VTNGMPLTAIDTAGEEPAAEPVAARKAAGRKKTSA
jgi:hypothetical protein